MRISQRRSRRLAFAFPENAAIVASTLNVRVVANRGGGVYGADPAQARAIAA